MNMVITRDGRRKLLISLALIVAFIPATAAANNQSLLFSDTFDQWQNSWASPINTTNSSVRYSDGTLILRDAMDRTRENYALNQTFNFSDIIVDVDTAFVSGSDLNYHVIACRYIDGNTHYAFQIGDDGTFAIDKYVDGVRTALVNVSPSHAITRSPGAKNHMHAECLGSNLSLSVNGVILATVQDSSLPQGRVALSVMAYEAPYTEISYDNLTISGRSLAEEGPSRDIEISNGTSGSGIIPNSTLLVSDPLTTWHSWWNNPVVTVNYSARYDNGSLLLRDVEHNAFYQYAMNETNTSLSFSDIALDVDTAFVSGSRNNFHMVACRYRDPNNFYGFFMSDDGWFGIEKYVDGVETTLVDFAETDAIDTTGEGRNHLHIECIGQFLDLEINGVRMASVQDDTFVRGRVALAAIAYDDPYTEIAYRNLTIRRPAS
jgi:hypothetical protein